MEIFKLFGTIMVDNEKANQSISKTEQKAESFGTKLGNGIKTAGKWGLAIGAAATAAGAALLAVTTKASETGDRVDKLSQKVGLSRQAFQEWDYVLGQNGIEVEKLQTGIKTMTDAMSGVGKGAKSFETLGIAINDSNGKLRSQEEVFADTVKALQGVEDQTLKASLATDLFGRAGTELMPLLNQTSASTEELTKRAHELGLVMSDDAVDASVVFGDTMDDVKSALGMVGVQVGMEIMPLFQKFLEWILKNMPEIKEVVSIAFNTIGTIVGSVSKIFSALLPILKPLWEFVKWAMPKIAEVIEVYFGAVAEIVGAVADAFEWVVEKIEAAYEWFKKWNTADFAEKEITVRTREVRDHERSGRSHAGGLPYVPYDGYVAELHRGEQVLTASEASKPRTTEFTGATNQRQTQPVNVSLTLDSKLLARYLFDALQDEENIRGAILGGAR